MVWLVYGVRLLSEMTLLLGVALGGAALAAGFVALVLAAGATSAAAAIWGTWIAPRASRRLDDPLRLGVEVAMFTWGGAGFTLSGRASFGVALVVVGTAAAVAMRWAGEPIRPADSAPGPATR
jgi:hypothetical protein